MTLREALRSFDHNLMSRLTSWHTAWLDYVMIWASTIGQGGVIWITLAVLSFICAPKSRAAAWRVLLTIALAALMTDGVLKPLIARARPKADETAIVRALPAIPHSASWPSGHAATAFGGAFALSRMWPAGRIAWWALAVTIGFSRIYLGHHYPLDVLAGAIVGVLAGFWVMGGRPRSTYASTLPDPLPAGVIVRP
jgi:undecaprenyl-diphosphatase